MTDLPATVDTVLFDAVGGVAGDMVVAALLEARPDLWPKCREAMTAARRALGLPEQGWDAALSPHSDGVLTGARFIVTPDEMDPSAQPSGAHGHRHWSELRAALLRAGLSPGVRDAALGIFERLAGAEASVHGVSPDAVAFHEVGAWDSVADIVAAATLIDAIGPVPGRVSWRIGPLPRGRGLVRTAHGALPVPAPAAHRLLSGFELIDDGEDGERVTPTGAAILAYLGAVQTPDPTPRRLLGAGVGFGARRLASRPNILRASLYGATADPTGDVIEVLRFEVDDQMPEDLAIGLDHLRRVSGVLDVAHWAAVGKKGRATVSVQVLVEPSSAEAAIDAAFRETATIGLRRRREQREILARRTAMTPAGRVKVVARPGGPTAKLEAEDLAPIKGRAAREALRREAEAEAEGRARGVRAAADAKEERDGERSGERGD